MGKVVGLVGSASGKIGNIVYAVTNGIQVARVYQPVVSNPKSSLQTMQRAKGNLAGRLSSFTPRTALYGLGTNARMRRGEFLRNILKAANITMVGGVYKAKIADEDVLFSKGSVPLSITPQAYNATGSILTVTLNGAASTAIDPTVYASMQTRLVAMVYDLTSYELVEVVTKMAAKPTQGGSLGTTLQITHNAGYTAVVYAIPMSTADGSSVNISTDIALKDDTAIAAELSVNRNAVVFQYGKSVMLGQSTYTPA